MKNQNEWNVVYLKLARYYATVSTVDMEDVPLGPDLEELVVGGLNKGEAVAVVDLLNSRRES